VVSVTGSPIDTIELPEIPFCATPAWLAAVQAADGLCQCAGACGKKHKATGGRCDQRQGLNGQTLHLAEDGSVYCPRCFNPVARNLRQAADAEAAEANAARYAQDDLFALLGDG
jgi:hypothetical protein